MLCACTSYATGANLAAIRDVLTQGVDVLVINVSNFVLAEAAWLLLKLLIKSSSFRALILRLF